MDIKKVLLSITITLSFTMTVASQSWFVDNPVWVSNLLGSWVIGDGVGTLIVVGDTVMVGQKCKLLNYNSKYKRLNEDGDTVLIDKNFDRFGYELDSRLFYYNRSIKDFELVYDFNLNGGDEIIFSQKCEPDTFQIFEVGTVEIDKVDFRYQKILISQSDEELHLLNVIEGIGYFQDETVWESGSFFSYPYPYFNINYHFDCIISEPRPNPVCFRNDRVDFIYDNVSCDTKRFVQPEELSFRPVLEFFSSDGTLFFRNYTTKRMTGYQILDLRGMQVKHKNQIVEPGKLVTVDLSSLEKGEYSITVYLNNGQEIKSMISNY